MKKLETYVRIPIEVNRIIFVRNLPFSFTNDDFYELFGKYGAVRQIRRGNSNKTKGSAYIIYEDIFDAKNCLDSLNGFQLKGKFLILVYFNPNKPIKG